MSRQSVDPSLLQNASSPGPFDNDDEFLLSEDETVISLLKEPLSPSTTPGSSASPQPEPAPPSKPVKKRKSWGQELPTPTTNLPPRKRAKTDAEKEQRRIERVLRNRAAAQSSRERKRKEVQALEDEKSTLAKCNADMLARLAEKEEANKALHQKLKDMEEKLSHYEHYMKVAGEIAAKANGDRYTAPLPADSPTIKEEEDPFLFLNGTEPEPQDATLDPVNLLSELSYDQPQFSKDGSSSMTHQSAELMCGLQCLQENPSLESWWGLFLTWINLVLWGLNWELDTSIPRSFLDMTGQMEGVQKTLLLWANRQPSLLNLSSISNKLNKPLQQRIQTSSQALARLLVAATGSALRLESVEDAFIQCSGSSCESERGLTAGTLDEGFHVTQVLLDRTRICLEAVQINRVLGLVCQ